MLQHLWPQEKVGPTGCTYFSVFLALRIISHYFRILIVTPTLTELDIAYAGELSM